MNVTDNSKEKPKRYSHKRIGCVLLLVIGLTSPLLCYAGIWLFARFGGEWATSGDIPIPEGSEFVASTYSEIGSYRQRRNLYISPSTPEEVRTQFIHLGVGLTPFPLGNGNFIEYDDYYATDTIFHRYSFPQVAHMYSVYITTGYFDDTTPRCQDVLVYKERSVTPLDFSATTVPDGLTTFVVTTCWVDPD